MKITPAWRSLVATALLLAGCSREKPEEPKKAGADELSMRRVTLPGFSVEAPTGKVVEHSTSPISGKYEVELPRASLTDHFLHDLARDARFVAIWSTQTSTRSEWEQENLPMYLKAMEPVIPGAKVLYREALDEHRWFSIVGGDRVPLGIGAVTCDPRFQVEITFSRFHELEPQIELIRNTLQSLRCDVKEDNRAVRVPSVRLPEGFGTVPADSGLQFRSLGGEIVVTNFTPGRMPSESEYYDPAIHAVLSTMDAKVRRSAVVEVAPTRNRRPGPERLDRARMPTLQLTVYVGSLYCEREGATLMFIWFYPGTADALAWERFSQVDCPGGEPLSLPTYASLIETACTRGDTAACEIKKSL